MKLMKLSEICRRAAKLVEDGDEEFSCIAVGRASKPGWRGHLSLAPAVKAYVSLMGHPEEGCVGQRLYTYDFDDWRPVAARDQRVVALCFAAAVFESEGQ